MKNCGLTTQPKDLRKLLTKKYIDLALSPNDSSNTHRNFNSSRLQVRSNFLHKKIYPESLEFPRKIDTVSPTHSIEETKSMMHAPAAQNSKSFSSSIKLKSIYFNDEKISKKNSEILFDRALSNASIRKGFQGYKYSILNSNRNIVKYRFAKQPYVLLS